MRVRAIRGIAVAGLVLGLLGCGDDDDDSTTAGGPDPGSTEPDGGTDADELDHRGHAAAGLRGRHHFGYISDIDVETDGGPYADFDVAQAVHGRRRAAGPGGRRARVRGGRRLLHRQRRRHRTSSSRSRTTPTCSTSTYAGDCCEAATGDLETFDADRNPPDTPVEITVADGEITRIEEIYFP